MVPKDQVVETKNRSTFGCPFCPQKNLARMDLIQHVSVNHGPMPGVCPICCSEEHGDPTYISPNLAGHMAMRHQCNYDELIDRNISEEEELRMILEKSMKDY